MAALNWGRFKSEGVKSGLTVIAVYCKLLQNKENQLKNIHPCLSIIYYLKEMLFELLKQQII